VPEYFLRGALIHPVPCAECLPRLTERMKMHHTTKPVFVLDACPFEMPAQNIVRRPTEPKDLFRRIDVDRPCLSQRLRKLRAQRNSPFISVLHRTDAKQRVRLRFVQMQIPLACGTSAVAASSTRKA
jgi:hypothetical protein